MERHLHSFQNEVCSLSLRQTDGEGGERSRACAGECLAEEPVLEEGQGRLGGLQMEYPFHLQVSNCTRKEIVTTVAPIEQG